MSTPPDDLDVHLEAELAVEEGNSAVIYDDATGKPFLKGMSLKGNISVGIGINLMVPFDKVELDFLETNRINKARAALAAYPWYSTQDEVRQVALADLTFNLGVNGLLGWPKFLSYMGAKDYPAAMSEIKSNTVWLSEVHAVRANRIEQEILTGQWPTDIGMAT
jgi:lysozyme